MRSISRGIAALAVSIALAACSGSGTGGGPTAGGTAPCADSTGTTTVDATVADFTWSQPVTAKVGDVITWTNSGSASHQVALDDGSCGMSKPIPGGGKGSLAFTTAGSFAFHCAIHASMKGTITITQ